MSGDAYTPSEPLTASLRDVTLLLIAIDSVMGDDEVPEAALARARKLYDAGVNATHAGDCTKQPFTCIRCFVEKHKAEADDWIRDEDLVPV